MAVTQEERDTFEAIRQKMLADQAEAIQEFAELAAKQEVVELFETFTALRDRCVAGSNEQVMLHNVVTVFQNVKRQFPPRPAQVAAPAPQV